MKKLVINKLTINKLGMRFWSLKGVRCRIGGPAFEDSIGTKAWNDENGIYYRKKYPAIEGRNGFKLFYDWRI